MFRQFRDTVLVDYPLGEEATAWLYAESEAALKLIQNDPQLLVRAALVVNRTKGAIAEVLAGEIGVIEDTDLVIGFLADVERKADGSLRQLAAGAKAMIRAHSRTGKPLAGLRFRPSRFRWRR
jgi:hypothetical protein